jgi:hypothetical protein
MRNTVTFHELVATIGSCPKGVSSDIHLLERYYDDVVANRLEDDALLFYGIHIEPNENRYLVAFGEAARKRDLLPHIRMRPGISTDALLQRLKAIREECHAVRSGVGKDLHKLFAPSSEVPELLGGLVHQLYEKHDRQPHMACG